MELFLNALEVEALEFTYWLISALGIASLLHFRLKSAASTKVILIAIQRNINHKRTYKYCIEINVLEIYYSSKT